MKLLYVTDQVYLHGGAEKILIQKLNYWADVYGYDVTLLTSVQKGKAPFFPLSSKVKMHDLKMGYPDGTLYHPKNFYLFRKQFKRLESFIDAYKPDAVFVLSQSLFHIITPFAAKTIPTYYEYHTSWYGFKLGFDRLSGIKKIKAKVIRRIADYAESRYTKIVYLNQAEFDHFKLKNAVIIPNFFDVLEQRQPRNPKKIAISLGRLSFQKGYDLLIEAWKQVDTQIDGWQMHVYGNGELREKLVRDAAAHKFKNPLHFFEAIDNINEKLSQASLYVMSSRFETFPMVLLEALSNQVPVVSFDCPTGPRSILTENEDGLIVPPLDVKALADAIVAIAGDEQKRLSMGAAGLKNVSRFSPESVMQQWDSLIRSNKNTN